MSKPRQSDMQGGRCVFCGGPGLSKEHVFSDWLKQIMPTGECHTQTKTWNDFHHHSKSMVHTIREVRTRQGGIHKRKIRNVCATCNSGWMAGVVDRAKPFAQAMATGKECDLNQEAQNCISGWVAIATEMGEFMDLETLAIPPEDQATLRERQCPPAAWTIFAGRCSPAASKWFPMHYRHHMFGFYAGHDLINLHTCQSTCYTIGNALFFSLSFSDRLMAVQSRNQWSPPQMVQVWPVKTPTLSWPCTPALSNESIDRIADLLHPKPKSNAL